MLFAACSSDDTVVGTTPDGEDLTRGEVFDEVDPDGDGVASRESFDRTVGGDAPAGRVSAEAFDAVMAAGDESVVLAAFPGGEVTLGDVLASLEESPPSALRPGSEPERGVVVARLTSMVRLRLSAVALTDLGFPVSLEGTDVEVNEMVSELIQGEFEDWAFEQVLAARPEIVKISSPHCLSIIAVTTEAEAADAKARVEAGERVYDVAAELNFEATTDVGGGLGCQTVLSWASTMGRTADPVGELEVGELSEPLQVPSQGSPTGELWVVLHIDEIVLEAADPRSLGPFAGGPLTEQMQSYDVEVHGDLGIWLSDSLSVSLPS